MKEHICSPTFQLESALRLRGADVRVHDPLYTDDELGSHGFTPCTPGVADWHPTALVLATSHTTFKTLDLAELRSSGLRIVVDGRRFWEPDMIASLGLDYVAPGRADPVGALSPAL